MKTVGDVIREIDMVQNTIEELHTLKNKSDDMDQICTDAIVLLSHYKSTLCELPLKR